LNDAARLARLPRGLAAALQPLRLAAASSNVRVALVGGAVRDRLLGKPISGREADVAVEGSAPDLARAVAATGPSVRARIHERFGTATLEMPSGWRVDLAGTRRETYGHPGALPDVMPATLEEDLARRDFTVNAMAWELAVDGKGGALHDPLGGREDLRRRQLRALHAGSFRDDPTRAFRAVRYANRLTFRVEPRTRQWIAGAIRSGAFRGVSGDRLRRELEKIFGERGWAGAVRHLVSLGVARALHPRLAASAGTLAALRRAEGLSGARGIKGKTTWLLPLLVWSDTLRGAARRDLAARLSLAGRTLDAFQRWPATREELSLGGIAASDLGSDQRVAAAAVLHDRSVLAAPSSLSIRGSDLLRAGIPAGPRVGLALARTRQARAAGEIGPADELSYALEAARSDPR
jgi:tRNA nucleotidyltransferase (CCA-adding enzyme)